MPTVTDGIGMGTEAMKYSMVSREVIADAIETSPSTAGHGVRLVVGGCDKNMRAAMSAMARMKRAGHFRLLRHHQAGKVKGQDLTIGLCLRGVGSFSAGRWSEEDFTGIEKNACPSVGACGGIYTANTMSSSFEELGMSTARLIADGGARLGEGDSARNPPGAGGSRQETI